VVFFVGGTIWSTPARGQATKESTPAAHPASTPPLSKQQVPADRPPANTAARSPEPTSSSRVLRNTYVGLQFGSISYAFSSTQLEPGFSVPSVDVPHLAVGAVLLGHEINPYVSFQVGVMRPARWVEYRNVNGDQAGHSVWMNIWGLTMKARAPINRQWSAFGEAGLGIVARKGFLIGRVPVVRDASYGTVLVGGGLEYRVNDDWSLQGAVTAVPGSAANLQPHTVFASGGFTYTSREHPDEAALDERDRALIWPARIWRVGFITNGWGYGANTALTKKIPIFWPGEVEVANGVSASYESTLLHTRRLLALDWGASVSTWKSRINGERFVTASVFPAIRLSLVRTKPADCYLTYSIAGPALITTTTIDDLPVGRHFTFQDYIGLGVFLGPQRRVTAELRIAHYSNGGLFPTNPGVTIPLGFYLGATF
jgi:hypothetical protein